MRRNRPSRSLPLTYLQSVFAPRTMAVPGQLEVCELLPSIEACYVESVKELGAAKHFGQGRWP